MRERADPSHKEQTCRPPTEHREIHLDRVLLQHGAGPAEPRVARAIRVGGVEVGAHTVACSR